MRVILFWCVASCDGMLVHDNIQLGKVDLKNVSAQFDIYVFG